MSLKWNMVGCGIFTAHILAPARASRLLFCCLVLCFFFGDACLAADDAGKEPGAVPLSASTAGPEAENPRANRDRAAESFRQGALDDAIVQWEAAARLYEREENRSGMCDALIRASQACQLRGQYRRALRHLEKAYAAAREAGDLRQAAAAVGALGNVYLGLGDLAKSSKYLHEGLEEARKAGAPDVSAVILNNVGNLHAAEGKYAEARSVYEVSEKEARRAGDLSLAASAAVNAATAALNDGQYAAARSGFDQAWDQLQALGDSYSKAYGMIGVAFGYYGLQGHPPEDDRDSIARAHRALSEAAALSLRNNDLRTASYAYGYLGKIYEDRLQYGEALELTGRAAHLAQQRNAAEALYRWQWQSGRILRKQGRTDEAIAAYRNSVHHLQVVRDELASCYANPQYSYGKTASAVCFELVTLLLDRASTLKEGETEQSYLYEARETLELLKVYELRDYFKDDCVDATRFVERKLDTISEKSVIIYPVMLKDRLELLVSFSGRLKRFSRPIPADKVTEEVNQLRQKMEKRTTWEFLPHAQLVYSWVILPLEKDLESIRPDTLVIVPDGPLRTIPFAALHDGKQFLISRYSVAVAPSLNLADPRPVRRENARVLAMGLTDPAPGYPALPYVASELRAMQEMYPGHYLLDREFSAANMEKELKSHPYSIVHIASHGQFGGDVAGSFVLTFDSRMTMNQLGEYVGLFRFRDAPLELLTLSACETAVGNERAALGLAGIAVRAGARSALATLWHVNDPASYELVTEFYRQLLNPDISRAAALRAAQLKLLNNPRYDHPGYWSPFLMINNWI